MEIKDPALREWAIKALLKECINGAYIQNSHPLWNWAHQLEYRGMLIIRPKDRRGYTYFELTDVGRSRLDNTVND